MPLKSFRVRNFQTHENLEVAFSPTVTTIVGPNDKGKSAFIRALQLVFLNKLSRSPDSYIRHGKKSFSLKLKIDGHTVIRKKGKGVNSYTIDATGWNSGEYIVRLSRGGAVASRKLVVGR